MEKPWFKKFEMHWDLPFKKGTEVRASKIKRRKKRVKNLWKRLKRLQKYQKFEREKEIFGVSNCCGGSDGLQNQNWEGSKGGVSKWN